VILANCSNVTVENQDVSYGAIGVHAEYSNNLTIRNNTSDYNFEDGIRLLKSENCSINNNSCNSSILGSGINIGDFAGADWNLIKDNICNSNNEYGIYIRGSNNTAISNRCNLSKSEDGIYVYGTYNKILNNYCEWNIDGIALNYADWNAVDNNICQNNLNGIILFTSSYNGLNNNTCNSNDAGIDTGGFSPGSNYNTLSNNTANSNDIGIYLTNSDYSKVENNTCKFNNFYGMTFGIAMYNIIHKNTLNSNSRGLQGGTMAIRSTYSENTFNFNTYDGIFCGGLQQSTFVGNNVSNNNVGMNLDVSRWNTFYDNIVSFNAIKGIVIDFGSNNNLLYHNNIISNAKQAEDNVSSAWSNSNQEGNYWSDYTGLDDGSGAGKHAIAGDGIGDTLIPHFGLDSYPFISSFYWWRITGKPVLNLVDSNPSDADYNLNWNSITNALGYELQEDSSAAFSAPLNAYKGSNLALNVINQSEGDYFYRVRAYNKYAAGPWSNVVNITVDIAPTAPKNLTALNVTGTDVELTWKPNPETDIQSYRIFINAPGAGESGPFNPLGSVPGTSNTYTVLSLQEETTYYFVVTALDNLYESLYSNVCTVTTLDESAPEQPLGLEAEAVSNSQIDLNWNASTALDLTGYFIYMNESGGGASGNFILFNTTIGSATSFSATGLAEEVTYHFKIIAFDEVPNNSSFSNVASATTLDATPPNIPTGLAVINPTRNSLTVTWNANTDSDLVGYMLYRSEYLSGSYTELFRDPLDSLQFIDTNLTMDTTYFYKLKAIDDVNLSSDFSEPASGTTLSAFPPERTGLISEISIPEDTYDDTTLNLYDVFTDQDTEELSFSVSGQNNVNAFIYASNGTVILEPKANWNGREDLTFYASDSDFPEIPYTITVIVTPVNDPPGLAQILKPNDGTEFDEGMALEFIGSCVDPDEEYGDVLTFKWISSKTGELGTGAKLTDITPEAGEHTIPLEVADKAGLKSTASITITIIGDDTTPDDGTDGDGTKDTGDDGKDTGGLGDNNTMLAILAVVIIIIIAAIMFFVMRKRRGTTEEGGETEIPEPTPPAEGGEAIEETAAPGPVAASQPEVPQLPEGAAPEVPPEPVPAEPIKIERSMLEELPKTAPVSEEVRATAQVVEGEPVTVIDDSEGI
jgi:parallel beta-helix repeat protein